MERRAGLMDAPRIRFSVALLIAFVLWVVLLTQFVNPLLRPLPSTAPPVQTPMEMRLVELAVPPTNTPAAVPSVPPMPVTPQVHVRRRNSTPVRVVKPHEIQHPTTDRSMTKKGPTGNASATGDEPLRTIYRECANAVIFCFAKQYAGLVSGFRRTCHQSADAFSPRRSSRGRLSGGRRRALRYPRRWNDRSRTLEADAKPPPERVTAGNAAQMAFFSRNARGTSRGESSGCACAFQCELDRS